tara:strand:- start:762 stop:1163 length:402 start_codon:yes stop_codon:yes gene_type:complete
MKKTSEIKNINVSDGDLCNFYDRTRNKKVFVGIADNLGIESFTPIDKADLNHLTMRAYANPHRLAIVYFVELIDSEIEDIKRRLENHEYINAMKVISYFTRDDYVLNPTRNPKKHRADLVVSNAHFWDELKKV